MTSLSKILALTKQLYPTGRAFKMITAGNLEKLHSGLALSEDRFYRDACSILDSTLPDNSNFSADDATAWEKRLGLITNNAVVLADRKLAIIRKMNHPGNVRARQNYKYLEGQLQAAGFNVYVYENRFPDGNGGYVTKTPAQVGGSTTKLVQFGTSQFGGFQYGGPINDKVVNYIDEQTDITFNVGNNLRSTFFIGGNPIGSYAEVDKNRKDEFRQLILKIKPVQTVGFLLVNYI